MLDLGDQRKAGRGAVVRGRRVGGKPLGRENDTWKEKQTKCGIKAAEDRYEKMTMLPEEAEHQGSSSWLAV